MERKLVLVVDDWASSYYYRPFSIFGDFTKDFNLLWTNPSSISLMVFTGGSDISPAFYGDEPSMRTYCHPKRDVYEQALYAKGRSLNIPIAGICRGAQFLCAMAGGKLYQHVNGHDWHHYMATDTGNRFVVSSTHHQMMRLPKGAKLLGWASPSLSDVYVGSNDTEMETPEHEVEVAHFPNINAVGMQYHPEVMPKNSNGFLYCRELIQKYLGVKQVREDLDDEDDDNDNDEGE